MYNSVACLCFNIIILNIVLTNKFIVDGKATKSPIKPIAVKRVATKPSKEFTKVVAKFVVTKPRKVVTKWPIKTTFVTEMAAAAAVPSIPPKTIWTTVMTPAKMIASVSPEMTPAKMIASVSPEMTPAKMIASVSPEITPAKIIASVSPEMTTAKIIASVSPEMTSAKIIASVSPEMTPAKMIASVSPEMTPGKIIATFSPEMTPAKMIASVSPEYSTLLADAAAVPSIPPKAMLETRQTAIAEGAAVPSIPPKTMMETRPPPVFEDAAVPSIPPKTMMETPLTVIAEGAAVPSIPPKTMLETPQTVIADGAAVPSIPPKTMLETRQTAIAEGAAVPSIPPKTMLETRQTAIAEGAAVPSIPPKTLLETRPPPVFEDAAVPSIPSKTLLETSPPIEEAAAVPSIPPKRELETPSTALEAAAVPSIPPSTMETYSTEASPTTETAGPFTVSLSSELAGTAGDQPLAPLSSMDSLLDGIQEDSAAFAPILNLESVTLAQGQVTNGFVNSTAQGDDTFAGFSDQEDPAESQVAESVPDSVSAAAAAGGGADFSESVNIAESQVNSGAEESKMAISNSVNTGPDVDYPSYGDVKGLYAQLLGGYDTRVRPKVNQSDVTRVSVFFSLLNILEFKTAEQTFDILGYFYFVWEDEFLTWRPRYFSRIQWIKVPMPEIWTPQFLIANMYDGDSKIGDPTDRVLVTFRGKVSWVPEATYKIVCAVEIEFYPFDKQTCKLTFHVSDDMASEVDMYANVKHNGIRTDHYIENSKWKLINASVEKYFVNDVSYMDVIIVVQRRIEFIIFSTVAPLMLVSILNVCAFLIPVESREKGEYSATIVITYGVFISHICASIPPNSTTIPYFLLYMIWMLGFSVSTVIYAIIQSRMYSHHGNRRIRIGLLTICFGTKAKTPDEADNGEEIKVKSKIETNIEEVTDADNKVLLCGDFLKKLDIMMIVVYVLSIIGTTAYFFLSMDLISVLT